LQPERPTRGHDDEHNSQNDVVEFQPSSRRIEWILEASIHIIAYAKIHGDCQDLENGIIDNE